MPQRKAAKCEVLHRGTRKACPKASAMAQRINQASFDPPADLGTDYALIAAGVGAALIALIYLILV